MMENPISMVLFPSETWEGQPSWIEPVCSFVNPLLLERVGPRDPPGFQPSLPNFGVERSLNPDVALSPAGFVAATSGWGLPGVTLSPFFLFFKAAQIRPGSGRVGRLPGRVSLGFGRASPAHPRDKESSGGPSPIPVPSCSAVVVSAHTPLPLPEAGGVMGIPGKQSLEDRKSVV